MSQPPAAAPQERRQNETQGAKPELLHRVCIQCNGVFQVTPEKFDAKQCPNCHKG